MKIGFVLDDSLDTPDGVQQYIVTLGNWFSGNGHEVHYLVGNTTRSDIKNIHSLSNNMQVRFNGNRMSMPLPADQSVIKELLISEQFDVLHVQMPYSPWLAHRVILAAPTNTAVIGTFHIAPHSWPVTLATQGLALYTKRSLKRFDKIFSVSAAAAEFAQKTYKVSTTILPNVVETAAFRAARPYGKYTDKPTIVFLGRLVPRKGCQLLLTAAVRLLTTYPDLDFRLIICGKGPLEKQLKAYSVEHQLQKHVIFTGFVTEADKARYLRTADLAVFPSSGGESFGIVLIEAMAAAHPVVLGADNPGYRTVLADFPELLFPINDAAFLADKIHLFLTNSSAHRKALDWQCRHLPQFDVAAVGTKLLTAYESVSKKSALKDTKLG